MKKKNKIFGKFLIPFACLFIGIFLIIFLKNVGGSGIDNAGLAIVGLILIVVSSITIFVNIILLYQEKRTSNKHEYTFSSNHKARKNLLRTYLIGVILTILTLIIKRNELTLLTSSELLNFFPFIILLIFILYQNYIGNNWARIVILILCLLNIPTFISEIYMYLEERNISKDLILMVSWLIYFVSTISYLLFNKDLTYYFNKKNE